MLALEADVSARALVRPEQGPPAGRVSHLADTVSFSYPKFRGSPFDCRAGHEPVRFFCTPYEQGAQSMSFIFLPGDSSKARVREAENARKNRAEIVKAYSHGQISRRDLVKWGLITSAGALAPISGLNPFIKSAYADGNTIPTGTPRSPL